MSPRVRKLLWGAFLVGLGLTLLVVYQRTVLLAGPASFEWQRGQQKYELLSPQMLGILLVVPFLLFALGRSLADLPWQQRILSFLLRLAFVALLALSLSRPARTEQTQRVGTVFIVDVSASVSEESLEDARRSIQKALDEKPADSEVRLVSFARRARLVSMGKPGEAPRVPESAELRKAVAGAPPESEVESRAGSDLQRALQMAYGVFPPGYLKRAVLLSDGVETEGDVLSEANRAKSLGVKVSVVPMRRAPPAEVAVRALSVPDKVDIGQAFEVTAELYASRAANARARLYQGETLNGLDGVRALSLKPGLNEVRFKSIVRVGGEVTYRLALDEISADKCS
jgi:hypothetical protein